MVNEWHAGIATQTDCDPSRTDANKSTVIIRFGDESGLDSIPQTKQQGLLPS